jgi:membrane fusion protein (multidrug efflux system)
MISTLSKPISVVLVSAIACFSLQGCMSNANGEEVDVEEEVQASVPVEAESVSVSDVAAYYSGTATLEADQRATIVSQTTGVILETLVEEGDYVQQDQLLARIETDRYRLEVQRAAAELNRLETDYKRKKELFDKKLVSAESFEQVSANYDGQKAAYDLAKLDLHYTDIRAPFAGYISARMVSSGNLISQYKPVFSITSFEPLLAVLHVPERELSVLRKDLPVSVSVDAWPGKTFAGTVTRISPVVDPQTGTFRVTAEIVDQEGMLKPGLFGRVKVLYDTHANVPVIPRNAVIPEDDQSHVFVVADDGVASRRPVQLGYERDGLVEVLEGLSPGERVVTTGKSSLNEGTRVEVIGTGA